MNSCIASGHNFNTDISSFNIATEKKEVGTIGAAVLSSFLLTTFTPHPWSVSPHSITEQDWRRSTQEEYQRDASILSTLYKYLGYPDNWDGYEGIRPTFKTVQDAATFLRILNDGAYSLPRPGLSGDGEIGFFWERRNFFADLGFTGDGTYSYYAKDKNGREYFGNNIALGQEIDRQFLSLISGLQA